MTGETRPERHRVIALTVTVLLLMGAAFWAGRVTLQPAAVPGDLPASEVVADVTEQTVGRTLNLNVTVSQPKRALAINALTGVVTEVRSSGQIATGEVLYRVAGVPVRAVQGATPFYRGLASGSKGADVRQLQDALVDLGHLNSADGTFGTPTVRAVRAWQKQLGIDQTGAVSLGELVAVPTLPSPVVLDGKNITLGGVLTGGEAIVHGTVGEPEFVLRLGQQQARLVPESATISMAYQGHQWSAVITGAEQNEQGETVFRLAAPGGGPVCGTDCAVITTGEQVFVLAQVAIVPPASGPAVPVAAITTNPDGSASVLVVDAASTRTPRTVTVKGSQDGVAVVDGIQVGERVQVLAPAGR